MPLLIVEGKKYRIGNITDEDPFWSVLVDEKTIGLEVLGQSSAVQRQEGQRVYFVEVNGRPLTVNLQEDSTSGRTSESTIFDGPALVNSPMAGKIASVRTSVDSKVEEGQSLMVLEAMKMQNEIASPKTGTVKELYVKHGDLVKAGDKLCLVS